MAMPTTKVATWCRVLPTFSLMAFWMELQSSFSLDARKP